MKTPTFDQYVTIDKYHAPQWLGDRAPRRFHVMVKPAGSTCNLDCTYCFYLSKQTLDGGPGAGKMDDEVLERFVRDYIASVTVDEVVFSWQGGEPTLRGLEFFRKVVALQRKHAKPGQRIENDLQTNGTLLDEDWAQFLKENRFLVGLSIDGPREIHDRYRITKQGGPTFDKVYAAAKMLQRFGVPFNTLTCVNRFNGSRPLDVYRFLRRELGSTYLQFIPDRRDQGLRDDGAAEVGSGAPSDRRQSRGEARASGFGRHRLVRRSRRVRVFPLQDLGRVAGARRRQGADQFLRDAGRRSTWDCRRSSASTASSAAKGVAIEHDGSVYACDHYVYPEYRLGNVRQKSLGDMVFSPTQVKFAYAKSEDACPRTAGSANYLRDCWGECPKNRLLRTPDGEPGLNYLCAGLKKFFAHAVPTADRMAARLRAAPVSPQRRM